MSDQLHKIEVSVSGIVIDWFPGPLKGDLDGRQAIDYWHKAGAPDMPEPHSTDPDKARLISLTYTTQPDDEPAGPATEQNRLDVRYEAVSPVSADDIFMFVDTGDYSPSWRGLKPDVTTQQAVLYVAHKALLDLPASITASSEDHYEDQDDYAANLAIANVMRSEVASFPETVRAVDYELWREIRNEALNVLQDSLWLPDLVPDDDYTGRLPSDSDSYRLSAVGGVLPSPPLKDAAKYWLRDGARRVRWKYEAARKRMQKKLPARSH